MRMCRASRAARNEALTLSDLVDGGCEVSVGFVKGQDQVDVGPVREDILQHAQLRLVSFLQFAQLALIC